MPTIHPRSGEQGQPITIRHPSTPTPQLHWLDPSATAITVPDGELPATLNGLALAPWRDHPTSADDWNALTNAALAEQELPLKKAPGMKLSAGVVVREPDGRFWVVAPTNRFGGYDWVFPKGTVSQGMSLQATALSEALEESGLQVRITGLLGDFARTTSVCRYYLAERIGGSPAMMGWESQAVGLVPMDALPAHLNSTVDQQVIEALQQLPPPEQPSPVESSKPDKKQATAADWFGLIDLPRDSRELALEVPRTFSGEAMACLRRGLIPHCPEQKWFAYYKDGVLHCHRSWTGIEAFQILFIEQPDAIVAYAVRVNGDARQWECQDNAENLGMVDFLLGYLSVDHSEEKNGFDLGLELASQPNYLGKPEVMGNVLAGFFQAAMDKAKASYLHGDIQAAQAKLLEEEKRCCRILTGEDPNYTTIGDWNSEHGLGREVIRSLCLDLNYYADENLFCILSEGLAGVGTLIREIILHAFKPLSEDEHMTVDSASLQEQIKRLFQFVVAVMMGSRPVLFPDTVLDDFQPVRY